jgi:hypothetical protein
MRKLTPKSIAMNTLIEISSHYYNEIPLDQIFKAISENGGQAVQEDGTAWSGFLCGESSCTTISVTGIYKVHFLYLGWYRMGSGRYEINAYLC